MSLLRKGAGDEGSLLLASRKLVDLPVGEISKVHCGDGFFGLQLIDFSKALEVSEVREAPHRNDVPDPDGEVALVAVNLRKVGDFSSGVRDGLLPPLNGAGLLFEKPGEEFDKSAFSGAVGT